MDYDDTIAAIATPPGEGGIGIVRISGPQAAMIAQAIFVPLRPGPLRSYRLRYGFVQDPQTAARVDEALLAFMRAPHSFTRQDVIELSCHGGPLPLQRVLELALRAGARLAQPGEFTLRAFLSGRIDLVQAEASVDVIRSQTDQALALAQAQLGGWLSQRIRTLREALLQVLAYLSAAVDFPEDDVPVQDVRAELYQALLVVEQLYASAGQGMIYRQGARAVLVGRPNAGKSSLLNGLLRSERAIVTPIPGTTRDTLEETAALGGVPVLLIDTAGITETSDPVEQLGVERSRAALAAADLALLVLDASMPLQPDDYELARLTFARPTLLVLNKCDLLPAALQATREFERSGLPAEPRQFLQFAELAAAHPQLQAIVLISALHGDGLELLGSLVARSLLGGVPLSSAHLVSNPRHRDILARAAEYLRGATTALEQQVPIDLAAGDLLAALNALGEITGESVGEDLLNTIFSRFCIGK